MINAAGELHVCDQISRLAEGISNFTLMLSVNLWYESIHWLRALGQPVYGFIGDSIANATLFALGMHLLGIGRREFG